MTNEKLEIRDKGVNMKKRCAGKTAVLCSLFIVLAIALGSCGPSAEEIEDTVGRLTFTGLDAYNGKRIFASYADYRDTGDRDIIGLEAWGGWSRGRDPIPAQISSGKATLKVYKTGLNLQWKNYNGHDNVKFAVAVVGTIYGFVTVKFTNGVASGVFVPDK